jgi:hypothetical protein
MNTDRHLPAIGYGSDVKWRVLVWVAVLIATAAAVVLGVVAVEEGLTAASGLAGVIVAFCELAAVVLAVIGWVGKRRPVSDTRKDETRTRSVPSAGPDDAHKHLADGRGGGKYVVNLGDNAQGTVIGDGNILHNDLRYSNRDHEYRSEESG